MNPTGNGESSLYSFQLPRGVRAALGFVLALPVLVALGCEATEPQPVIRNEPSTPQAVSTAPATPPQDPLLFSAEELKQVAVELKVEPKDFGGVLKYLVHNGSERILDFVIVEITVKSKDGEPVLAQSYRLSVRGASPPAAEGPYEHSLGFTLKDGQTWTWRLVRARAER